MDPKDLTTAVHGGVEVEARTGAIMTPIFQTSTYVQKAPGEHTGYDYSRAGNPTRDQLEAAYAALEGVDYGLSFSSGLAAVQAVIQTLEPGCEVLVCDDVYGGTGRLFRKLFSKYNITFHFVDLCDEAAVSQHLSEKLSMIWVETPTNPLLKIIDITKMYEHAKKHQALLVVDNTFSSPIFQKPFEFGADIVLHSTTKYMGGHSDLIGGALMVKDKELFEKLKFVQFAAGAVPSPFECFLTLRSLKTLAVRMMHHEKNARAVAEFLEGHKKVKNLRYPGLTSHPQHDLARHQMRGFSGMVSFNLDGSFKEVTRFFQKLKIFSLAESLGGVESLANHPEKMTHASVPPKLREALGINETLIRLSVGIESTDDLIADLKEALEL